jgi:uncharacterized protein YqjF (DUF2071 family)
MRHGRQRNRKALFTADWLDAAFVHFRIDPRHLQPLVPLPLDLFDGQAYVSFVAFTQRNLHPTIGGALAAWLATPLATHEFLNIRTYVRHRSGNDEVRGIFFIAEWIPNRLACLIGPRSYGLPYRFGRLDYQPTRRCVSDGISNLIFEFSHPEMERPTNSLPGSLDHFLLERYTAFTHRHGVDRSFQVDHAPWPIHGAAVRVEDSSLLSATGDWHPHAQLATAHVSAGVRAVTIGAPKRIQFEPRRHGGTEARSASKRASVPPW